MNVQELIQQQLVTGVQLLHHQLPLMQLSTQFKPQEDRWLMVRFNETFSFKAFNSLAAKVRAVQARRMVDLRSGILAKPEWLESGVITERDWQLSLRVSLEKSDGKLGFVYVADVLVRP